QQEFAVFVIKKKSLRIGHMSGVQGTARYFLSNTVETLTGKFFPGVSFSQLGDSSYGNEVVSSLSLQMVIYFSALFFPCWLVTSLVMMTLKFQYVSNLYQFILAAIYFAVPLIEVIRLYIGHVGNLEEKSLTKTHQYVLWDPSVYRVMHTAATQPPATVSPVQIEKSSGCS
ncbi:hypothetical protein OTU49_015156, partial [Cherax quadricarinatus]